jgi:hypothetical protein
MLMLNGLNDVPGYIYLGGATSAHYVQRAKSIHVVFVPLLSFDVQPVI